ncbi:MAG TPA: RodZ domain-containing protein [Gaiellaceae bacterium]|nr:RodZ domain-containing protein [Gaiellaceae bacterium]
MSATRGDCWALVRAGSESGAVLYSGVLHAGTSVTVHGRRLWARFGASSNLDFRLNGKPVQFHQGGTVDVVVSAAGFAAALPAAATSVHTGTSVQTATTVHTGNAAGPLCGSLAGATKPPTIEHVVWIFMENKSEGSILGAHADPFIRTVASECGLATNYHNITHPSLPNYLAATSGSTHGVASDCHPTKCMAPGPSIFSQLVAANENWRSYVENMPVPCDPNDQGVYAVKHNPALYYAELTGACDRNDVPLEGALEHDLAAGRLPAFSMIVPNTCDDMHSCAISKADAWLRAWVGRIAATQSYQAGDVVVFITWDEGGHVRHDAFGENCAQHPSDQSCHVALLVLSEYTRPGTADPTLYTHYSLLLTTEQLLGLHDPLGAAADPGTHSLRDPFGL